MHDIKAIRENPAVYDAGWESRGLSSPTARILDLDQALRAAQTAVQSAQSRRNEASKQIGAAKAQKDEAKAAALMAEVEGLKAEMAAQAEIEATVGAELRDLLASLPNIPDPQVPAGADETGNVEQRRHGDPRRLNNPRDHVDIGAGLGGMDFEAAARMSGSRFVVLKKGVARLERALGQYMLDLQTTEHGYTEVNPPVLVREHAMFGTGQLPKFEDDLFSTYRRKSSSEVTTEIAAGTNALLAGASDKLYLVPTAEVSLTNLVREQITDEAELPLRLTALTNCFRSEAGSAGRDTRGMIRQHQFQKVELVAITTPEQSAAEHDHMVASAEEVLKRLGLSFRTMLLCTGDMGFSARKTYDLEVWLPSQNTYREISSVSNCGDFQARRMDARGQKRGEKGTRFLHTLNGSGLAVGRTLVAVLENYQDEGGRVAIPDVLVPYMGGVTHLEPEA
ncbi:serine--tRNA ligase [Caulobacter mirabilis]|uniref:Serine--tRNA ligase n=1 Tax=Caulobacter mirabilis TaxID=69666 RepID=A0A2D2AWU2_9CAUL|nr:serine--tRNA ligase [Caulobacter mirabilis]ATQ42466.1 serine--tRNA ligase [Caulobacter mirabilis]